MSKYTLGKDKEKIIVDSLKQSQAISLSLAEQAQKYLHIFSPDLDLLLYNNQEFVLACKKIALNAPKSFVHILVKDSYSAVQHDHRLINLAQHLSPHIQIRKIYKQYEDTNKAFLVADNTGFFYREIYTQHEGIANFNHLLQSKEYTDFFQEVWERSETDTQTRRISL